MSTPDGIFTHPGPDGIFGRGGEPSDGSGQSVDGDGASLRETLVAAFPSPGHMRVARAIRHPRTGKVEFQEQYRVPTPAEVELLKQQGVTAGSGSMIQQMGGVGDVSPAPSGAAPQNQPEGTPWVKLGIAVAVGAAGFWAVNKWVMPMFGGGAKPRRNGRAEEPDDGDEPDDRDD